MFVKGWVFGVEYRVFYGEFLLFFLSPLPFGFTLFFGYFLKKNYKNSGFLLILRNEK